MNQKTNIISILITATLLFVFGCGYSITETQDSVITIVDTNKIIELNKNQECEYYCAGGDEEGATIKTQAKHFAISEINRNSETNYAAVYKYKPSHNYIGNDSVELEIYTGSDGASEPTNVETVKIVFLIK